MQSDSFNDNISADVSVEYIISSLSNQLINTSRMQMKPTRELRQGRIQKILVGGIQSEHNGCWAINLRVCGVLTHMSCPYIKYIEQFLNNI